MESIKIILDDAQARIQRIGTQEMEILDTQMEAIAKRMALGFTRIGFDDKALRLLDAQYGHGQEPSVYLPGTFQANVIGEGAVFSIGAEAIGTLPAHDYRILRFITPNLIIPPVLAARMFTSDVTVRSQMAEIREAFARRIGEAVKAAVTNVYGSTEVLPFDFLGSLTMMGKPEIYVWRNIVGDLIGLRCEIYFGFMVLPDRGVSSATADAPVPSLDPDPSKIDPDAN